MFLFLIKNKMTTKPKKIKFICPAKVQMNSKEEYLSKLKPILGQNQINLSTFINDFNKKSIVLNPDLIVRSTILKNQDKSYDVMINYPPIELILNTLKKDSSKLISINQYQDIIIALDHFNFKMNNLFFNSYSKTDRFKIYSKILICSIKNLNYGIK